MWAIFCFLPFSGKYLKFLGTSNMEQCLSKVKRLFDESECRKTFRNHCFSPLNNPSTKNHPNEFYAFSTYYYTSSLLRLSPGDPLNLKQSWSHAQRLCESNYGLAHPLHRQVSLIPSSLSPIFSEAVPPLFILLHIAPREWGQKFPTSIEQNYYDFQ